MEYCETSKGSRIKVALSDEELQLPAIDDLCNKYFDWLKLSKEAVGGRKTRSANRRADTILEEIISFKLPPIRLEPLSVSPIKMVSTQQSGSTKTSMDGESDNSSVGSSSGPSLTRTLRPRCRTPSVSRQPQTSPSTPTQQSLRAHLKKNIDSNGSSVLSAALNQQHPSVSVTKIRQLLRADSAQKKRDEEKERQERIRMDRKAKEERAEAQKKQLLEERAITAKLKREQRLLHAAEVRRAREKSRLQQKLLEDQVRKAQQQANEMMTETTHSQNQTTQPEPIKRTESKQKQVDQEKRRLDEQQNQRAEQQVAEVAAKKTKAKPQHHQQQPQSQSQPLQPLPKAHKLDETFKKPQDDADNIDISVHDETTDETKSKTVMIAAWAKTPYFREAVIAQFSKPADELLEQAKEIFSVVKLPVDLKMIFGEDNAVNNRYLCRTSSAIWSPPRGGMKRTRISDH